MTPEAKAALKEAVGPEGAVTWDDLARRWAGRDAAGDYRLTGRRHRIAPVAAVAYPGSPEAVAAVVRWARTFGVALVPRGAGTGVMGGAVPLKEAVVVDLSRLKRVAVDPATGIVEAEAGAVLGEINRELEAHGLMLVHDPWSVAMATVGGAVSTDGVGYHAGRWGSMGQQVVALEVVTPDGERWQTQAFKSSVGPDLRALFIGSQGSFGIVTRVWVQAVDRPEVVQFATWRFAGFEAGFDGILRLWRAGLRFDLLDFSDQRPDALDLSPGLEDADGRTALLRLAAMGLREEAPARLAAAARLLAASGGVDLGPERAESYWQGRHLWAERFQREVHQPQDSARRAALGWMGLDYLNLALWPQEIPAFRRRLMARVAQSPELTLGETGIWGMPWLFSAVLFETEATHEEDMVAPGRHPEAMQHAIDDLVAMAQAQGGNAECIHGLGLKGLPWSPHERGHRRWVSLKRSWDPDDLFNPGKISPE
ncbi:MAG: FAD-binding oxidoreductase [Firmicutes bacterium]|nr:FAD-binding oxidoreductase [Alicyclobacillaceae bacterium]MCL6498235.1 FAD-binding oxidoreductase [Bacillota bacterium]